MCCSLDTLEELLEYVMLLGGNDLSVYGDPNRSQTFFHVVAVSSGDPPLVRSIVFFPSLPTSINVVF